MGVKMPPKPTKSPCESRAPSPVTELLSLQNEPNEFSGEIETYHKYTVEMDTLKKGAFVTL